ncbi:hypothetical protein B4N89_42040 [Embleya scabrispora]|uniref:Chaplin domain-containing protein n=1 Tax=Embleya scabrispora TaxID=159449 RepID=A0A1T3NJX4_9ACTN|nr:hypothetical protein [Embleya scabrispora]OPC77143.1 hypothetical protein B4N89_42040 [Embleya scabrispora]
MSPSPSARRTAVLSATVIAVTALEALTAGAASATTVIGGFNGTFGNACVNTTDDATAATGITTHAQGIIGGHALALPISGPANQCANLGLPQENSAEEDSTSRGA